MCASNPLHKILMVCLGNICRSPTAQGVMETLVCRAGLQGSIVVDSAGTGGWHVGAAPDPRAADAALKRGYDLSQQRARQVLCEDFEAFDHIFAMDRANLKHLLAMSPPSHAHKVSLLLDHAGLPETDVPDPYYGGDQGFEQVLDMVEAACAAILNGIKNGSSATEARP